MVRCVLPRENGEAVTGAIFGLVGVVVGGLLTAAVQVFQESRSQRTLSLAAARLLSAELSVQEEILVRLAKEESAEPVSDDMPPVSDWPDQRAAMARTLDDETWTAVAAAYARLVLWHWENRKASEAGKDQRDEISTLVVHLHAAREKLHAFRFGSDAAP